MDAPPPVGDPYDLLPAGVSNRGSQGVMLGWDSIRTFWGGVVNQAWQDLENVRGISLPI